MGSGWICQFVSFFFGIASFGLDEIYSCAVAQLTVNHHHHLHHTTSPALYSRQFYRTLAKLLQSRHQLYAMSCGSNPYHSSKRWPCTGVTVRRSLSFLHPRQSICLTMPGTNRERGSPTHRVSVRRIAPNTPVYLTNSVPIYRPALVIPDQHQGTREKSLCHVVASAIVGMLMGITWSPT